MLGFCAPGGVSGAPDAIEWPHHPARKEKVMNGMEMGGIDMSMFPLASFLLLSVPLAIVAYLLAPRVGSNRWLWAIGALIPFFNFIFMYYVAYKIVARILDRLNAVYDRIA